MLGVPESRVGQSDSDPIVDPRLVKLVLGVGVGVGVGDGDGDEAPSSANFSTFSARPFSSSPIARSCAVRRGASRVRG